MGRPCVPVVRARVPVRVGQRHRRPKERVPQAFPDRATALPGDGGRHEHHPHGGVRGRQHRRRRRGAAGRRRRGVWPTFAPSPISRKRGLSKKALAARLHDEDIDYHHLVALGTPKSGRDAARAGQDALFRTIYAAHVATEEAQGALRDLAVLVRDRPTCLLCFERDPATCHRSIVAEAVAGETGFDVLNLFPDPVRGHVGHSSERRRLHPRQGASPA